MIQVPVKNSVRPEVSKGEREKLQSFVPFMLRYLSTNGFSADPAPFDADKTVGN